LILEEYQANGAILLSSMTNIVQNLGHNLRYEMKPPCLNSKIHNPYIARNLSCFQLANKGEQSPKA
jgi:hypothetical protein